MSNGRYYGRGIVRRPSAFSFFGILLFLLAIFILAEIFVRLSGSRSILGVAFIAMTVVMGLTVLNPLYGVTLLTVILAFNDYEIIKIPFFSLTLADFVMFGVIVSWTLTKMGRRERISLPLGMLPLLGYLVIFGASIRVGQDIKPYLGLLMWVAGYLVLSNMLSTTENIRTAMLLWPPVGVAVSAYALYSFVTLAGSTGVITDRYGLDRQTSVFMNANSLGYYLMPVAIVIMMQIRRSTKVQQLIMHCAFLFIIFFGILLSGSRGAFIGTSIATAIFAFREFHSQRRVALVFLLLVILFQFVPHPIKRRIFSIVNMQDADSSTYNRMETYALAWAEFTDHPIAGIGFNQYSKIPRLHNPDVRSPHSMYLAVIVEQGIPGITTLVLFILTYFLGMTRALRKIPDSDKDPDSMEKRLYLNGYLSIFVAIVVISLFGQAFMRPYAWFVMAFGSAIAQTVESPVKNLKPS